jgi:alkylhydroperoxidase family enzyme
VTVPSIVPPPTDRVNSSRPVTLERGYRCLRVDASSERRAVGEESTSRSSIEQARKRHVVVDSPSAGGNDWLQIVRLKPDLLLAPSIAVGDERWPGSVRGEPGVARIEPIDQANAQGERREVLDEVVTAHGRATNMKRTLARSPVALRSLMTWYDLRDEVARFLGDRATALFAHAISAGSECLICSTFFRRLLIDAGDDPDDPRLDEREALVVEFGRQLARDPHGVSDDLFARLSGSFLADQIVALTALGGLMVATNLFNNALRVDLDEYLWAYRKADGRKESGR